MSATIQVGKGTFLGRGVTVFPVWTDGADVTNVCFKTKHLTVTEVQGDPDVNNLQVTNNGHRDHIVVEGDIFEGGWQNRVAAVTTVIGRGQTVLVPVACVEQGRWNGSNSHGVQVRRAPYRTRSAMSYEMLNMLDLDEPRDASVAQSAVWQDIQALEMDHGFAPGHSLTYAMSLMEDAEDIPASVSLMPGQRGVMIGIGGYIVAAEIFGSHDALKQRFDAIISAARFEGMSAQDRSTPNFMARDFASILENSVFEGENSVARQVNSPVGPLAVNSFMTAAGLVHAAVFNQAVRA